ncbi:membrane-associated protein, putative [Bodo saltans]|uniref:Membrane-associated protein, putative n=1 Tax=Bodo saltans TaxID=75058 RepID=A0A0S4IZ76_BODSA|nr:membrane-associated protein, putative [Bodo saltans]|eukprot:CUG20713.1 membrane-associated protein, putative [Bodo saltans]
MSKLWLATISRKMRSMMPYSGALRLLLYAAQLMLCLVLRPMATVFGSVIAATTLSLTITGTGLQVYYLFCSKADVFGRVRLACAGCQLAEEFRRYCRMHRRTLASCPHNAICAVPAASVGCAKATEVKPVPCVNRFARR